MPTITVEFEVYCACGAGLCRQTDVDERARRMPTVTVEPCERCKDQAYGDGLEEGRNEKEE